MFNWFKKVFGKQDDRQELLSLLNNQQALIKGLQFAVQELQYRYEDSNAIACLLLNKHREELEDAFSYEELEDLKAKKLLMCYEFSDSGLNVWLDEDVLNDELDIFEEEETNGGPQY